MSTIALMSGVIGLATSAIPAIITYLRERNNYQHEREILKLQIELAKQGQNHTRVLEAIRAAGADLNSARQHDSSLTGDGFFDNLRKSVRPAVTYMFVAAFFAIKITILIVMIMQGFDVFKIVEVMWDDWTAVTFSLILGFWFGDRGHMYWREYLAQKESKG